MSEVYVRAGACAIVGLLWIGLGVRIAWPNRETVDYGIVRNGDITVSRSTTTGRFGVFVDRYVRGYHGSVVMRGDGTIIGEHGELLHIRWEEAVRP